MLAYKLFKTQNILSSATSKTGEPGVTYLLFKTQSMLLSATSRKGQPGGDLLAVQNPDDTCVSNKQKGPARS